MMDVLADFMKNAIEPGRGRAKDTRYLT